VWGTGKILENGPILVVSADAGLRKSLAFVLAAEGFTTVDYADLASARTASMLAACRCAIVDEVAPNETGDLSILPAMPMIVLCDRVAPERQRGQVRYVTKPILGPNLTLLLHRLLDDAGHAANGTK
jgi:DNA-binding response OmpR family regulator